MSPRRDGFTLIEMLVALAVFALAAMALMKLTIESTRTAAMLEQRTVAGMVAAFVDDFEPGGGQRLLQARGHGIGGDGDGGGHGCASFAVASVSLAWRLR